MKTIKILPLVFLYSYTSAQIYFNRTYDSNNNTNGATSIISDYGSGHVFIGQAVDTVKRSFFICNIDQYGDTLWTKLYGAPGMVYYTGVSGSIIHTMDGNYAFAGSASIVGDTVNTSDAMFVKFDKNGDTLWTKIYGGPYYDAVRICDQTIDGGFILIGDTRISPTPGSNDFLLIKTDNSGNVQWEKTYGGSGYDVAISGQVTMDGGFILSGGSDSWGGNDNHYVVKTDSMGNLQWQKIYGTLLNDGSCHIKQTKDRGYILIGFLQLGSGKEEDGAIRKIDKDGNQVWLKTFGSTNNDWYNSQAIELEDNSIITAGSSFNAQNKEEGWILKVSPTGDSLWSRSLKFSSVFNGFFDIKETQDKGFIMCGYTWNSKQDAWVVKVDSLGCEVANCNISIDERFKVSSLRFQIYPNPNNGRFILRSEESTANITFFNVLGKIVQEEQISQSETEIDISNFPAGIYILKIEIDEQVSYVKLVRE